jgi:hypothetical protein
LWLELLNLLQFGGLFPYSLLVRSRANSRIKQAINIRAEQRKFLCQADSESIHFPKRNEKEKEEKRSPYPIEWKITGWAGEGRDSNLATISLPLVPASVRSLLSLNSLILISPDTKGSVCEWPLAGP